MRIVYLSRLPLPSKAANGVNIMKMCEAFAENGHEVTLMVPDHPDQVSGQDPFSFYGVAPRFEIKKLPYYDVKGRRYLYAIQAAVRAGLQSPDLAYGRCLFSCFFVSLLGVPVIFAAHDPFPEYASRGTKWIHARLLKSQRLRRLVVNSEGLKRIYRERYAAPTSKLEVAPNAATAPAQSGAPPFKARSGRLQVGYVGNLYRGRGMETICELAERCAWADFRIIGGNEKDLAHWKTQTEPLGNVFLYGFVPHAQTDAYRQACDVLLAPYQRDVRTSGGHMNTAEWMSPIKIFEYMAAARPILCSDLPALRDLLTHGETAWFCSPDDSQDWAEALTRLRDEPEERRRLGEAARHTFERHHTWTARAQNVLKGLD